MTIAMGSVVIGGDPDSGVSTRVSQSTVRGGDVKITAGHGATLDVNKSDIRGGNAK